MTAGPHWRSLQKRNQRLQAVANNVRVRELALMRKHFPFRKEEERRRRTIGIQPGFQVLLETFLRFQIFRDHDDGPFGKFSFDQRSEERPGGWGDAGKGQRSAMLQSL